MTKSMQKIMKIILICVIALSICISFSSIDIKNKLSLSPMADTLTYSVQGLTTGVFGTKNHNKTIDLSAAKVVDNEDTEYAITSIAIADGNSLPDGLTLTGTVISGTPTAAIVETVAFNFLFTDTDGNPQQISKNIIFNIAETLHYNIKELPSNIAGRVDTPLTKDLSAVKVVDNEDAEYAITSIAIADGNSLPAGLTLTDTVISGTPTAAIVETVAFNFLFTDTDGNPQQISENIIFNIAETLHYNIKELPSNISGRVDTSLTKDLSAVKVVDNEGTEYTITSIAIADGNSLPAGLTLTGTVISGTPTVAIVETVTFNFLFTDADGNPQSLSGDINFKIIKVITDIEFSNIPNATFIYDISNSVSLNAIGAKVGGKDVAIKSFACVGQLPLGLSLTNGHIDGKASQLQSSSAVQFSAIFEGGEIAYFNVKISVERQALKALNFDINTYIYNGIEQRPVLTVLDQALQPLSEDAYDIKFYRGESITTDLISVGAIRVEVIGKGNYGGTQVNMYIIESIVVDDTYVKDFDDVAYDGDQHMLPPLFDGYTETGFEVLYSRNGKPTVDFINVGSITVKITFSGNYKGTVIKSYNISAAIASINDIVFMHDVAYDGKSYIPTPKVDKKWVQDVDYIITILKNDVLAKEYISAGEYLVKVDFINNVSGNFQQIFKILPKEITPILAGTINYTYDGQIKAPTTYLVGDYKVGIDYDLICYRGVNVSADYISVGEIKVVVTMKGNYIGSAEATYTINPQSLIVANTDNYEMSIAANGGFLLTEKFSVKNIDSMPFKIRYSANEKIEYCIKIDMLRAEEKADLTSLATVKLKTHISSKDIKGIRIEYLERGIQQSKTAAIDSNGYIVFDIYSVGEIAIIVDYPAQNDIPSYVYWAIGGGVLLLVLIIILVIYLISKNTGIRTILPNRRR